jgi:uncharacterized protein (UPF0333 family)
MLRRDKKKNKGQSILEYTMLILIVASAFMAMGTYIRRAVQANLKMIEDQVNPGP